MKRWSTRYAISGRHVRTPTKDRGIIFMPTDASAVRLGQRLRKARLARNFTQSEVAQQKFSVSYISAVERGQIRPSLGALEKLADRLHIPLAELLRDDTDIVIPQMAAEKDGTAEDRTEFESRVEYARVLARQRHPGRGLEQLQSLPNGRLSDHQQAEVRWAKADCLMALRRADEARSALLEAIPLAERANDQELVERLRLSLGSAYTQMHKYQLALDAFKGCHEAIQRGIVSDPVFRFEVLYNLGSQYRSLGDTDTAIEILTQAADVGEDVTNPARLGALYATLCDDYLDARDFRRAKVAADQSASNFAAADNKRMIGDVHNRLGRAYTQSGDLDAATRHLEYAHSIAEREQDARGLAEAERGLAAVYVQQHRIDDAATAATHALSLSRDLDDAVDHAESLLMQAHVDEAQQNYAAAEANFKEATELLDSTDATQARSDAYARYSEFLERRGQGDDALKLLRKAWNLSGHTTTLAR